MQINVHNGTNGLSPFKVHFVSSLEFIINEVLQYPFTAHQIHVQFAYICSNSSCERKCHREVALNLMV